MLLLMIACPQQAPDNANVTGITPEDEACSIGCGDTQLYEDWDEALEALGYDPWYPADPQADRISAFVPDFDSEFDFEGRPFYAVLWESDNEAGFEVSGGSTGDQGTYVEGWQPDFWVCTFDGSTDPFKDPNCALGLLEVGWFTDTYEIYDFLDTEGDGLYVPEDTDEE